MKAHEKKKAYRLYCAKRLKAGEVPSPATGNWDGRAHTPDSTRMSLQLGASHNR